MDESDQAQAALGRLVDAWRAPVVAADVPVDGTGFENPDIDALVKASKSLDERGMQRLLTSLAEAIADLHGFWAAHLAMIACHFNEQGGESKEVLDAIFARFAQAVPLAEGYYEAAEEAGRSEIEDGLPDELDPAIDPEGYCGVAAVRFFALAVLPVLAGSAAARANARNRSELTGTLALMDQTALSGAVSMVSEILSASDGETVVVVCPETRRGAQFRTTAVRNCAHLYTLVDLVIRENKVNLLGGWFSGSRLDPAGNQILDAARGGADAFAALDREELFVGKLILRPWNELEKAGGFTPLSFVGIDAPMGAFSRLDGSIVLGAGDYEKHGPRRSWDIGFFEPLHENLRSDLAFEKTLSKSEVDAWMGRIFGG